MITYIHNKNNQVPYLIELRLVDKQNQDETLILKYKPQHGHACDPMTKYNGRAWYDLMYAYKSMKKEKGG